MKIFNFKNFQVTVDPEVLTVPEFFAIWEKDKSKDKSKAFKELAYVYHMADFNSPYSNLSEEKKKQRVGYDIMKNQNYSPPTYVVDAINKYKELSITPKERLLMSAKRKIDQVADYMDSSNVSDETLANILKIFKDLQPIVANFDNLEEAVRKEKLNKSEKRRAGRKTSLFED